MAWKMCLAACLLLYVSEIANHPQTEFAGPILQEIDEDSENGRQIIDETTQTETAHVAPPVSSPPVPFANNNPDIQANHYPLYARDIELLVSLGTITLPHPEGGTLTRSGRRLSKLA